jgi:hypothetical protein
MSTQIILKVPLALPVAQRQRDLWTRCQLDEFQGQALRLMLLWRQPLPWEATGCATG